MFCFLYYTGEETVTKERKYLYIYLIFINVLLKPTLLMLCIPIKQIYQSYHIFYNLQVIPVMYVKHMILFNAFFKHELPQARNDVNLIN